MKEAQRSAASWKRASYALGAPKRTSWMLNLLGSAGVMADTSQIGVSRPPPRPRLQARDFTNFGYPCWDGIKDTFRIL